MAITLAEIAKRVGVHVSLVSRVLRDDASAKLSPAKRAQIIEIAKATGYRPNRLGRSLRTGRTSIIGVIAPDITNPFYAAMFRGVEGAAAAAGYDTILVNTNNSLDRLKEVVSMLAEGHVDGALIATAKAVDESVDWLAKERLPYVLINRRRIGADDPWVGPDDFQTGYLGASHLLGLGHKRIAFLLLDLEIGNIHSRLAGIRAALVDHGRDPAECLIRTDLKDRARSKAYVKELLALPVAQRPTAFFAPQTILSDAAMHAIYESGFRVPEEVSMVGYTAQEVPDFTSIRVPLDEIGRRATQYLIAQLSGDPTGGALPTAPLPVSLVDMGSTARRATENRRKPEKTEPRGGPSVSLDRSMKSIPEWTCCPNEVRLRAGGRWNFKSTGFSLCRKGGQRPSPHKLKSRQNQPQIWESPPGLIAVS